jgi:hypothetical protein
LIDKLVDSMGRNIRKNTWAVGAAPAKPPVGTRLRIAFSEALARRMPRLFTTRADEASG